LLLKFMARMLVVRTACVKRLGQLTQRAQKPS
jgi:hypothetical protein